ncbi:MAG: hypothetical protein EBT22_08085 [Chloroflexi bacterium]|nr:hypothetical protein [Chloroflexota bacterium]
MPCGPSSASMQTRSVMPPRPGRSSIRSPEKGSSGTRYGMRGCLGVPAVRSCWCRAQCPTALPQVPKRSPASWPCMGTGTCLAIAGIVALHGHGNMLGKELVTGTGADINGATPEELSELIGRYHSDFGARFARRGYVVITPDALGFGERVADRGAQHHQAMGRVVEYLGYTHTGLRLLDDIRALSILSAWPGVDASRIGVVGLSEGGKRTMFLSAFDERVRTAVVSGYFTTIRQEVEVWNRLGGWDLCNTLPGLLRVADLPEIVALIAPRPLLIQNGRGDPLYTLEAVARFGVTGPVRRWAPVRFGRTRGMVCPVASGVTAPLLPDFAALHYRSGVTDERVPCAGVDPDRVRVVARDRAHSPDAGSASCIRRVRLVHPGHGWGAGGPRCHRRCRRAGDHA